MLDIRYLYAGYVKNNPILKGVNLSLDKGEVVGILGKNGCGKSTLAKAICGILPYIEQGDILFEKRSLGNMTTHEIAKCGIGYFQQGGRVFPNLTGDENITLAASGLNMHDINSRIKELSEHIELLKKSDRLKLKASYLSGGEKHQLALAMVLLTNPKLLILDEPSAGLSPSNQKAIYSILDSIRRAKRTTILLIEQNAHYAKEFADYVVQLEHHKPNLLFDQLVKRKEQWIGGILEDFGDSRDRQLGKPTMQTTIKDIELIHNLDQKGEVHEYFSVMGEDFTCDIDTQWAKITYDDGKCLDHQEGCLVFEKLTTEFRIKPKNKKI